jgi:hypothetical protein
MVLRSWLRENSYVDIADLIDSVRAELKAKGSKERRSFYEVLAGGKDGQPIVVSGHEFPVLKTMQLRQGKPITPNAIQRSPHEQPPDVVPTKRWPRRRLPSKAKRSTNVASRHDKKKTG